MQLDIKPLGLKSPYLSFHLCSARDTGPQILAMQDGSSINPRGHNGWGFGEIKKGEFDPGNVLPNSPVPLAVDAQKLLNRRVSRSAVYLLVLGLIVVCDFTSLGLLLCDLWLLKFHWLANASRDEAQAGFRFFEPTQTGNSSV